MKILYTIGDRLGAAEFLYRFLQHKDPNWEIKVAGYHEAASKIKYLDWCLDAIYFNSHSLSYGDSDTLIAEKYANDIKKWQPNLIICDHEYFTPRIAQSLNIPLWISTPLHSSVEKKEYRFYATAFWELRKAIYHFKPEKILINSPFVNLAEPNSDFIKPYFTKAINNQSNVILNVSNNKRAIKLARLFLSKYKNIYIFNDLAHAQFKHNTNQGKYEEVLSKNSLYITDGATESLADAIYNNCKIIVSPSFSNTESGYNGLYIKNNKFGQYVGQIELLETFAPDYLEDPIHNYNLNNSEYLQLHETIKLYE